MTTITGRNYREYDNSMSDSTVDPTVSAVDSALLQGLSFLLTSTNPDKED
jgi:hypothetical protein